MSLTGGKTRLSVARVFHRLVIRPLPLSPDSSHPDLLVTSVRVPGPMPSKLLWRRAPPTQQPGGISSGGISTAGGFRRVIKRASHHGLVGFGTTVKRVIIITYLRAWLM